VVSDFSIAVCIRNLIPLSPSRIFAVANELIQCIHVCMYVHMYDLLDNNLSFEGIPGAIGKLTDLEHFIAARNQLKCIPEGMCRMYFLKRLVLTSNSLVTLPEGLHHLKLEVSGGPEVRFDIHMYAFKLQVPLY